jgi:hypothetical protein
MWGIPLMTSDCAIHMLIVSVVEESEDKTKDCKILLVGHNDIKDLPQEFRIKYNLWVQ